MSGSGSSGRIVRGHSAKLTTVDRIGFDILYSSQAAARGSHDSPCAGSCAVTSCCSPPPVATESRAGMRRGAAAEGRGWALAADGAVDAERRGRDPASHPVAIAAFVARDASARSTPRPARDLWTVWYWASFFVSLRPFCHFLPHFCFCFFSP